MWKSISGLAITLLAMTADMSSGAVRVFYIDNSLKDSIPATPVREYTQPADAKATGTLRIEPTQHHQTMAGIGAAFSEMGALALQSLPNDKQEALLKNLFDTRQGAGFSMCRLPIGASDFATSLYSCDDTPEDYGMKQFTLARDEKSIIPLVRAAIAVNPNLRLWGSPWSPPGWMKVSGRMDRGGADARLRDEDRIYKSYALYLQRWVTGYQADGITISRICPQNEMDNPGPPGCVMTPPEMIRLVDEISHQFTASKITTEIWAGTFRESKKAPWAAECLENETFRHEISGLGIQYYDRQLIASLGKRYPDLRFMFTEADCHNGENSPAEAQARFSEMIGNFNVGCDTYSYWNMLLDETHKSFADWVQNSLVIIDRPTGVVRYMPDFQPVCLVSRFVRPGSVRVDAGLTADGFDSPVSAFVRDGNEISALVQNRTEHEITLHVVVGNRSETATLPPHADCVIDLP